MRKRLLYFLALSSLPSILSAEDEAVLNTGDTAWIIVATTLVMLMTPAGLALFYGGMARAKNLLNTIAMSVGGYIVAGLVWVIIGFSIAFGTDLGGGIVGFDGFFLTNIGLDQVHGTIPEILFATFQLTFAGITLALISGSLIERLKFSTWLIFSALWIIAVYAPIAHWVWSENGWLAKDGVLDFAGGTVVHINAGIAGLVIVLLLGKRADFGKAIFPSSVSFTVLGAILLWFGWFGFNGGSELAADAIAANAVLVTNIAASAAALAWLIIEYITYKKFTLIGIASGIVAGLVAITPAAGFVDTIGAFVIGIGAGVLSFYAVNYLKRALKYDDSLDVFGVHAISGIWGAIATGIFANPAINSNGVGLLYGNPSQVLIQIEGIVVTIIYTAIGTAIVFGISSLITKGARVDSDAESQGLDETEHGERAFNLR
ncbi:MAG: ammonium transporter [Campylobacteraceae bacterium]|jgi:Amt family ammonium transporter|nr:ammonium transporter [Campylobacteraceae bacterium]